MLDKRLGESLYFEQLSRPVRTASEPSIYTQDLYNPQAFAHSVLGPFIVKRLPMSSEEINLSGSRVLIADDNEQNRELLDAYLADEDFEILMAADGQETLEVVDANEPDLILLDIMMPRMSGYEVCEKLKADAEKRKIPVLMVTALNEMGDIEKAVNSGCDDFLTKPVNQLELKTRVRSLLRVRHLSNERDRLLAYLEEMEQQILPSNS